MTDFTLLLEQMDAANKDWQQASSASYRGIHQQRIVNATQDILGALEQIAAKDLVEHFSQQSQGRRRVLGESSIAVAFKPSIATFNTNDNSIGNKLRLFNDWRIQEGLGGFLDAANDNTNTNICDQLRLSAELLGAANTNLTEPVDGLSASTNSHNRLRDLNHLVQSFQIGTTIQGRQHRDKFVDAIRNFHVVFDADDATTPGIFERTAKAENDYLNADSQQSHHIHFADYMRSDRSLLTQWLYRLPRMLLRWLDMIPVLQPLTRIRQLRNLGDDNRKKSSKEGSKLYKEASRGHRDIADAGKVLQQLAKDAAKYGGASSLKSAIEELSKEGLWRFDHPCIDFMDEVVAQIQVDLDSEADAFANAQEGVADLQTMLQALENQLANVNGDTDYYAMQHVLSTMRPEGGAPEGGEAGTSADDLGHVDASNWQFKLDVWKMEHAAQLEEQVDKQTATLKQEIADKKEEIEAAKEMYRRQWNDANRETRQQELTKQQEDSLALGMKTDLFRKIDEMYSHTNTRTDEVAYLLLDHLYSERWATKTYPAVMQNLPQDIRLTMNEHYLRGCRCPSIRELTLGTAEANYDKALALSGKINPIMSKHPADVRDAMLGGYDESLRDWYRIPNKLLISMQQLMKPDDAQYSFLELGRKPKDALELLHEATTLDFGNSRRRAHDVNHILMNVFVTALKRISMFTESTKVYDSMSQHYLQDVMYQMERTLNCVEAIIPMIGEIGDLYVDKNVVMELSKLNMFTRRDALKNDPEIPIDQYKLSDVLSIFMREFVMDLRQDEYYKKIFDFFQRAVEPKYDPKRSEAENAKAAADARRKAMRQREAMEDQCYRLEGMMQEYRYILPVAIKTYDNDVAQNNILPFKQRGYHQSVPTNFLSNQNKSYVNEETTPNMVVKSRNPGTIAAIYDVRNGLRANNTAARGQMSRLQSREPLGQLYNSACDVDEQSMRWDMATVGAGPFLDYAGIGR